MEQKSICVVCSGNICRSPFVEYILKRELPDYHIFSAGTLEIWNQKAYEVCRALAPEYEISLEEHRSQGISCQGFPQSDYILVMTENHYRSLPAAAKKRARLLSEYLSEDNISIGTMGIVSKGDDIPDPMGQSAEVVKPVLDLLEKATMAFVQDLKEPST